MANSSMVVAIALLPIFIVALSCAKPLTGWKKNLDYFAPYAGLIVTAIIAFDAFVLQHWVNIHSCIALLVNAVGFGLIFLGALIIWYRRWPKLSKEKAERIALDFLKKGYPQEDNHRIKEDKTVLKRRNWEVTVQLTPKNPLFSLQIWSFDVAVDAKNGKVVGISQWPSVKRSGDSD